MNRTLLAFILAEDGNTEEANRLFEESLAIGNASIAGDGSYFSRFIDVAAIHAYRGSHDEALQMLRPAFDAGFLTDYALRTDPMFEPLRGDPQFDELLSQMLRRRNELLRMAEDAGALIPYDRMIAAGPLRP